MPAIIQSQTHVQTNGRLGKVATRDVLGQRLRCRTVVVRIIECARLELTVLKHQVGTIVIEPSVTVWMCRSRRIIVVDLYVVIGQANNTFFNGGFPDDFIENSPRHVRIRYYLAVNSAVGVVPPFLGADNYARNTDHQNAAD